VPARANQRLHSCRPLNLHDGPDGDPGADVGASRATAQPVPGDLPPHLHQAQDTAEPLAVAHIALTVWCNAVFGDCLLPHTPHPASDWMGCVWEEAEREEEREREMKTERKKEREMKTERKKKREMKERQKRRQRKSETDDVV